MGKEWRDGLGSLIDARYNILVEFCTFGLVSLGLLDGEIWGFL